MMIWTRTAPSKAGWYWWRKLRNACKFFEDEVQKP